MQNYKNSDYAANKFAAGIVYRFADKTVEVSLADYLRENPGKTEADFTALKALSDEMYREQDRTDYRQSYRDVSLHGLDETDACCVPSSEEIVFERIEQDETLRQRRKWTNQVLRALTKTQRQRYLLHVVDGLSSWKIAQLEGVKHQSVLESLESAEKKIKKILENG